MSKKAVIYTKNGKLFQVLVYCKLFLTFLSLVCAKEHVLDITNLLSLLGRMWVSCHHCFFFGGACFALLLHGFISKPAWFYGFVIKQNCFLVCFNLQGSSILFLYLQSLNRINNLITYFVPLLFISLTCLNLFFEGET